MSLAGKIGWAGIAFTLLTTAMLGQALPRSPTGPDLNREEVAVFVIKDEIKKVQETLRGEKDTTECKGRWCLWSTGPSQYSCVSESGESAGHRAA
jgi:hypothetical protein